MTNVSISGIIATLDDNEVDASDELNVTTSSTDASITKVIGNRKRNRSSSSALSTEWAKKSLDEKHHKGNAIAYAYMIAKENDLTFRREQAIFGSRLLRLLRTVGLKVRVDLL